MPRSRPSQAAAFWGSNKFNLRLWNSVNPCFALKERERAVDHILRNPAKFFKKMKNFFANGSPAGLGLGGKALTWAGRPHRKLRRAGDLAAGRRLAPRPGRAGETAVSRPLAPSGARGRSCRLRLEPVGSPSPSPSLRLQYLFRWHPLSVWDEDQPPEIRWRGCWAGGERCILRRLSQNFGGWDGGRAEPSSAHAP